jgi:hypothetical protein
MRFTKSIALFQFTLLGVAFATTSASATARIHIDLSTQRMHVDSSNGSYDWAVSTARSGYSTPRGYYAPTGLQRMHYSKKYHLSPMPYSIFFRGGYAIHGTYSTGSLGRPASHGCVRLSPGHAAALYQMVQREGGSISITGSPAGGGRYASARHHRHATRYASLHNHSHAHAMAYASRGHWTHHHSVKSWQRYPIMPLYDDPNW